MKKMFVLLLVVMMVLMNVSATAEMYCNEFDKTWKMTTMVVADNDGDYDIRVNARVCPDISAPVATVLDGGTLLNVSDFWYSEDGRIWAECWFDIGYLYVSVRYLQPLPVEGSFFYLPVEVDVLRKPCEDAEPIATFVEDQLILVSEIVKDEFGYYWAKVSADYRYGYIQLFWLNPIP